MKAWGMKPKQAVSEAPPFPNSLSYLWADFLDLQRGRRSTGFGPDRFSWLDVKAWTELRQIKLAPWEVDALMTLDVIWLNAQVPEK